MSYLGFSQGTYFDPTTTGLRQLDAERLSGNNSETNFTLSRNVASPVDIEVYVENVRQEPNVAYTTNNTTGLAFTSAPPSGTDNIYVIYKVVDTRYSVTVPDASITYAKLADNIKQFGIDNFTANGTGTTFDLSETPASVNAILVSNNGIIQVSTTDYTVSGNTLILNSAPNNGDSISVRHLGFRVGTSVSVLSSTGVSAGTYGGNTAIPVITVGLDGRVSSVANVAFVSGGGDVTKARSLINAFVFG